VVIPLEPVLTDVSLLGVQVLEIVIHLKIKYILDLHVQVHKFFRLIIFSKWLP